MKTKRHKITRIEEIMPKALQKQIGLNQLSSSQLANLNAWLNLPRTKAVLGPGPGHER
jgi:Trm5-related predicted tRNA methylase